MRWQSTTFQYKDVQVVKKFAIVMEAGIEIKNYECYVKQNDIIFI